MTCVYASPIPSQRRSLWHELRNIRRGVVGPWYLGGDFNATLLYSECLSAGANRDPDKDFYNFVTEEELNDMGFIGPRFTWKRSNVESRIDRLLCSSDWLGAFPNAMVSHLPWYKSDHRPLLLQLHCLQTSRRTQRPFRFLAPWVLHEQFDEFVKNAWNTSLPWKETVREFTDVCVTWNVQVFGSVTTRKKRLIRRLNGIMRAEAQYGLTENLEVLQQQLWRELNDVLLQESLLWAQKARCEWHINGDKNTRFFHMRANGRRKRNFVGAIKDASGEWVYNVEKIKSLATEFFSTLFTEDMVQRTPVQCSFSHPRIETNDQEILETEVVNTEIKEALFSMGALKAPGPDGPNALFYQNQWKVVENSLCSFIKYLW
ncbi:uncharacterized protein LOC114732274 [Neltuma alba]|uniref:uncharacterized protein LOC114732274 n=1 Tax=Neltuma alba TaxID=207710 RepID=UPI0010A35BCE|nr:uncharacterized protein LOC114732274 [Prosopis alba]